MSRNLEECDLRPAEVYHLRGDCSKAQRELGWTPTVTFEELVKMMADEDLETLSEWLRAWQDEAVREVERVGAALSVWQLPVHVYPAPLAPVEMPLLALAQALAASCWVDIASAAESFAQLSAEWRQPMEAGTFWDDYQRVRFGGKVEREAALEHLAERFAQKWRLHSYDLINALDQRACEWECEAETVKQRIMAVAVVLAFGELDSDEVHEIRFGRTRWVKDPVTGTKARRPLRAHHFRHVRRKLEQLAKAYAAAILTEDGGAGLVKAPSAVDASQVVSLDSNAGSVAGGRNLLDRAFADERADPLALLVEREDDAVRRQQLAVLAQVLDQMPRGARAKMGALLSLLADGRTLAEASRLLGLTEGYGRVLLHRFRKRLDSAAG